MSSESVNARKRSQRKTFRALRNGLSHARRNEADDAIEKALLALPEYGSAKLVLTYLDMGTEIRTRGIIRAAWDAGKAVALPGCVPNTRRMRWFLVESLDGLVRSPLGVEEPVPTPEFEVHVESLDATSKAIAIVPGLTFDRHGYRMGYGGGFYDTFLSSFVGTSVGLCRSEQLCDDLRAQGVIDDHDLPVDFVVTDLHTLDCR